MVTGSDAPPLGEPAGARPGRVRPRGSDGGPPSGRRLRPAVVPAVVLVLVGVICAPLAGGGWVLLLDWSPGPRSELWSRVLDRSALPSGPVLLALAATVRSLAGPAVGWLPFAGALVALGLGAARLAGPSTPARLAAAVLAVWNPFVYDRLYAGQLNVLLGAAVLPFLVHAVVGLVLPPVTSGLDGGDGGDSGDGRGRRRRVAAVAAWWSLATAVTVHLFWLGLLVVVAAWPVGRLVRRGRPGAAAAMDLALAASATAAVTLAWMLASGGSFPDAGDADTVATFASRAEPAVGLTLTLLSQGGFWREAPGRPLPGGGTWVLATAATWGVAAVGAARAVAALRTPPVDAVADDLAPPSPTDPDGVHGRAGVTAGVLVVAGMLALVAAHGTAGPAGGAYAVALERLPGFAVMREPGKFVAVVSLALAVCFALGIERLVRVPTGRRRVLAARVVAAALLAAVAAGSWPLAGGLGGRVRPAAYPEAWRGARAVLDLGSGPVLVVPSGAYLDPGFTDGRIVANPAPGWFGPEVVVIDDPGVPGLRARGERERTVAAALRDAPRPALVDDLLRAGFTRVLALDADGVAAVQGAGTTDPPGFVERFRSGDVVVWDLTGAGTGAGVGSGTD